MPDIQLTVIDPVTGLVTLALPDRPKVLTGMALLTQVVTLQLLKNIGRDVFDYTEGSDLRAAIGQYNLSSDNAQTDLRSLAITAVRKIEREIIDGQGQLGTPEERLKKLDLQDVVFDDATATGLFKVKIVNEVGDTQDVVV